MITIARAFEGNSWTINAGLALALAALVAVSPAEARLGDVVKLVYLHGAAERVSTYAYLLAGALGLAQLARPGAGLGRWTRALVETAILFWLAQMVISLPAQVLAWGGIVWDEPRVVGAFWILVLTALVYAVARWVGEPSWVGLAAAANAALVIVVLRGAVNILHPLDPIVGSDSAWIKLCYAAIVVVTGAIAVQCARHLATRARVN